MHGFGHLAPQRHDLIGEEHAVGANIQTNYGAQRLAHLADTGTHERCRSVGVMDVASHAHHETAGRKHYHFRTAGAVSQRFRLRTRKPIIEYQVITCQRSSCTGDCQRSYCQV